MNATRNIVARIFLLVALFSVSFAVSQAQQVKTTEVVYVMGNVKNPSGITIVSGMRLADALEAAGGVRDKTRKVRVAHYRVFDGESKLKAKLDLTLIKKKASQNVLLEAYDIIDVSDKEGSFGHPSGKPLSLTSQFPPSQVP